ncbi:MAG TPA: aldolase [Clostridiales bacterium]|nr:aldolase [Clostridiales bacterium]
MNKQFSLRERILSKEVVLGLFYKFNSQAVVEMVGHAGFDFIIIDTEHANFSSYDVEGLIRAADGVGMSSVVRVREAKPEDVLHALDSGADGVQIPSIRSADQAVEVCATSKYYPQGNRGLSMTQRSGMYSAWPKDKNYFDHSNNNSLVVVHVENKEMADNVEELLKIPQLDVVFIGPGDLSQSLGKPGQMNAPEVVKVIEEVIEKVLAKGKAAGIYCGTPEAIKQYVDLGVTYIAYGSDVTAMAKALKDLKISADNVLKQQ